MNAAQRKKHRDEQARRHAEYVESVRAEIEAPLRAVLAAFEVQLDEQAALIADLRHEVAKARMAYDSMSETLAKVALERDLLEAFNHDTAAELANVRKELSTLMRDERDVAKLRRRLAAAHAERDDERAKRRFAEAVIKAQSEIRLVGKDDSEVVIRRAEVIAAGES